MQAQNPLGATPICLESPGSTSYLTMTPPKTTASTTTQAAASSNKVAVVNNKTTAHISSQEVGKTAGSLAHNNKMRSVDATHGQKAAPTAAPMAVATLQKNVENIGDNPRNTTEETHNSSQESRKSAGSAL
jgi:hypothetical protein